MSALIPASLSFKLIFPPSPRACAASGITNPQAPYAMNPIPPRDLLPGTPCSAPKLAQASECSYASNSCLASASLGMGSHRFGKGKTDNEGEGSPKPFLRSSAWCP